MLLFLVQGVLLIPKPILLSSKEELGTALSQFPEQPCLITPREFPSAGVKLYEQHQGRWGEPELSCCGKQGSRAP